MISAHLFFLQGYQIIEERLVNGSENISAERWFGGGTCLPVIQLGIHLPPRVVRRVGKSGIVRLTMVAAKAKRGAGISGS